MNVAVSGSVSVGKSAHLLSGYLCGTHSGPHAGRGRRTSSEHVARAHRALTTVKPSNDSAIPLHATPWVPREEAEVVLRDSLESSLRGDGIVDLVVFGSVARGTTTGFSDLDAVLVISDEIASDVDGLRRLRKRVLAAQRAVLRFQPMQHHGFLVATPRMLYDATAALRLPVEALSEGRSLCDAQVEALFPRVVEPDTSLFHALCAGLLTPSAWPSHVWEVHRLVAMFELVPTLYLQANGRPSAKHASFEHVRPQFETLWKPYDVLAEVRERWPRERHHGLELGASLTRNPWTAVCAVAPRASKRSRSRRCLARRRLPSRPSASR